jgi:hypothetical protein
MVNGIMVSVSCPGAMIAMGESSRGEYSLKRLSLIPPTHIIVICIIAIILALVALPYLRPSNKVMIKTGNTTPPVKIANLEKLLDKAPQLGWNKDFTTTRDQLKPELDLLGEHFTQNVYEEPTVLGVKIVKVSYQTGSGEAPHTSLVVGYPFENGNDQTLHPSLIALATHNGSKLELFPGFVLGQSTLEDAQKLFPKPDKVDALDYLDQKDIAKKSLWYTLDAKGRRIEITLSSRNGVITACTVSP